MGRQAYRTAIHATIHAK